MQGKKSGGRSTEDSWRKVVQWKEKTSNGGYHPTDEGGESQDQSGEGLVASNWGQK